MTQNTDNLQAHLRWALEELDRYVIIGGDGIARNRCEGQMVTDYIKPYSAAKTALSLSAIDPSLKDADPTRPITPLELLAGALSHMTPEEHAELAEEAKQIVARADRAVAYCKKTGHIT